MSDFLFISRLIPEQMDNEVRSKMMSTMDDAAIAWQHHIIQGIEENINKPVKLLNFLPVRAYPKYYKDIYIKRSEFAHSPGAEDINLPFFNLMIVKRLFQGISMKKEARKWASAKTGESKTIIVYTLYPEFLQAAAAAKKIDPGIKVFAIVLDLPEYSVLTNNIGLLGKIFLKWNKKKVEKQIKCVDSFAFLTEYMRYPLGVTDKPYCIIEGICSDEFKHISCEKREKTIVYAGTLHERFGVMKLVEAFEKISSKELKLVICGYGDSEEEIKKAAARDGRISFLGQLKRDDVMKIMASASVIVNPRGNGEEFTKYSFPSKNLEALSSGVPFVAYKLDGIPDEYDEFINYPSDDSVSALSKCIYDVCIDLDGQYSEKAKKASEWVNSDKNCRIQAKKLLKLILEDDSE